MTINQLLKTHPHRFGSIRGNTLANQVIHVFSESVVNPCNKLCHANSIAKCIAATKPIELGAPNRLGAFAQR